MIIAKQMEVRNNIKRYFDDAYDGEIIIVPRRQNKNVVIISEENYRQLSDLTRLAAYSGSIRKTGTSCRKNMPDASGILADNLKKLDIIANLEDNWNGNGAAAFPEALILKVRSLLEELIIQPEIFPTALQTVQFEYDNSRHDHMEIDIGLSDTAELFISTYFGEECFENIVTDVSAINKRTAEFYG